MKLDDRAKPSSKRRFAAVRTQSLVKPTGTQQDVGWHIHIPKDGSLILSAMVQWNVDACTANDWTGIRSGFSVGLRADHEVTIGQCYISLRGMGFKCPGV